MRHIEISSVGFSGTTLQLQCADSSAVSKQVLEAMAELYNGEPAVVEFNPFVVEFSLKPNVEVKAFFERMAEAITDNNKHLEVQIPRFPKKRN